jgi:hypothetical protein
MGIVSLKDQVMDLLLEELNDCVALSDLSISISIMTLSYGNQLTHTTA